MQVGEHMQHTTRGKVQVMTQGSFIERRFQREKEEREKERERE